MKDFPLLVLNINDTHPSTWSQWLHQSWTLKLSQVNQCFSRLTHVVSLTIKAKSPWLLAVIMPAPWKSLSVKYRQVESKDGERDISSAWSLYQTSQLLCKLFLFLLKDSWIIFPTKSPTYYSGEGIQVVILQLENTLSYISPLNSSYIYCSLIVYYFLSYCPHHNHIELLALSCTLSTCFCLFDFCLPFFYINALPSQSLITLPLKHLRILSVCPLVDLTL